MIESFCEPEVDQFGEALRVDHDVFGFEVSENDVLGVQVADGIEDSCHVEHGGVVVEATVAGESREELASLDVLEHHVDVFGVLESGLAK